MAPRGCRGDWLAKSGGVGPPRPAASPDNGCTAPGRRRSVSPSSTTTRRRQMAPLRQRKPRHRRPCASWRSAWASRGPQRNQPTCPCCVAWSATPNARAPLATNSSGTMQPHDETALPGASRRPPLEPAKRKTCPPAHPYPTPNPDPGPHPPAPNPAPSSSAHSPAARTPPSKHPRSGNHAAQPLSPSAHWHPPAPNLRQGPAGHWGPWPPQRVRLRWPLGPAMPPAGLGPASP